MDSYQHLLAADPNNAEAKAGMAECAPRCLEGEVRVGLVELGQSGRLALDGMVALFSMVVDEFKQDRNRHSLEDIVRRSLGKRARIVCENFTYEHIEESAAPPSWRLDEDRLAKVKDDQAFDVVIAHSTNAYEHTKYVRDLWDKPPLVIDVTYRYVVFVKGEKLDEFSFEVTHREPSDYGKDEEQKRERQATLTRIIAAHTATRNRLKGFLEHDLFQRLAKR